MEPFIYRGFIFRDHPVGCNCGEHGNVLQQACVTTWRADRVGIEGWFRGYGIQYTKQSACDSIINDTHGAIESAGRRHIMSNPNVTLRHLQAMTADIWEKRPDLLMAGSWVTVWASVWTKLQDRRCYRLRLSGQAPSYLTGRPGIIFYKEAIMAYDEKFNEAYIEAKLILIRAELDHYIYDAHSRELALQEMYNDNFTEAGITLAT